MRVAAAEHENTAWALMDVDSQFGEHQSSAAGGADVAGSVLGHGVALRPMLAMRGRIVVEAASHVALHGKVLITGGLGGKADDQGVDVSVGIASFASCSTTRLRWHLINGAL
jgi:hypothetical protein